MSEITLRLQQTIRNACQNSKGQIVRIEIPKGDYALETLRIPENGNVLFFSKERVRLLYNGKRNRPLFVLEDNTALILDKKIEIYYNTNNMREVMRLMIRRAENSRVEISKEVKISLFSVKK